MSRTVMAENGRPFTDWDAANLKRQILEDEVGCPFTVQGRKEGQWVIVPAQQPVKTRKEPGFAADEEPAMSSEPVEARPETTPAPTAPTQTETVEDRPVTSKQPSSATPPFPTAEMMAAELAEGDDSYRRSAVHTEEITPKGDYVPPPFTLDDLEQQAAEGRLTPEVEIDDNDGESNYDRPMSFKDAEQYEREAPIETLVLRPAPRAFIDWIGNAFVGLAVCMYPRFIWQTLLGLDKTRPDLYYMATQVTFIVGVLLFFYYALRFLYIYYANRYVISADSVMVHQGLIKRKKNTIKLQDVRSVDTDQSIIERLFKVGTVSLGTAGTAGFDVILKYVANPTDLEEELNRRGKLASKIVFRRD